MLPDLKTARRREALRFSAGISILWKFSIFPVFSPVWEPGSRGWVLGPALPRPWATLGHLPCLGVPRARGGNAVPSSSPNLSSGVEAHRSLLQTPVPSAATASQLPSAVGEEIWKPEVSQTPREVFSERAALCAPTTAPSHGLFGVPFWGHRHSHAAQPSRAGGAGDGHDSHPHPNYSYPHPNDSHPSQVQPQQTSPLELPRAVAQLPNWGQSHLLVAPTAPWLCKGTRSVQCCCFLGKNTHWEKALREEEDAWAHTGDPSAETQQEHKKKALSPLPKQEVLAATPNSLQEKLSWAALAAWGLFPDHTAEVSAGLTNGAPGSSRGSPGSSGALRSSDKFLLPRQSANLRKTHFPAS